MYVLNVPFSLLNVPFSWHYRSAHGSHSCTYIEGFSLSLSFLFLPSPINKFTTTLDDIFDHSVHYDSMKYLVQDERFEGRGMHWRCSEFVVYM